MSFNYTVLKRRQRLFLTVFILCWLAWNTILIGLIGAYIPTILLVAILLGTPLYVFSILEHIIALAGGWCRDLTCEANVNGDVTSIPRDKLAVVMTVCDDFLPGQVQCLSHLSIAGYHCFLLDDSSVPVYLPHDEPITVVRRSLHTNGKAGNLNHWLQKFGRMFDCVFILDSDCSIELAALDHLRQLGGQRFQDGVAILQCRVFLEKIETPLDSLLYLGSRYWTKIVSTAQCGLGTFLGWGHNQLCSISALYKVGGFVEDFVAEDPATGLALLEAGYRIELVDIPSYERGPLDFAVLCGRRIRVEAANFDVARRCRWNAGLLPILRFALVGLGAFQNTLMVVVLLTILWSHQTSAMDIMVFLSALRRGDFIAMIFLAYWLASILVLPTLAALIWLREQLCFRDFLLFMLVNNVATILVTTPLLVEIAKILVGVRQRFVVTLKTRSAAKQEIRWKPVMWYMLSTIFLVALIFGTIRNPLAGMWCSPFGMIVVLSPWIVRRYRDR